MERTLGALAEFVQGKVVGNPQMIIRGIAGIREAKDDEITFLANARYVKDVESCRAGAIIVSPQMYTTQKPAIVCDNPYLAFAKILTLFHPPYPMIPEGIHPTAIVHPTAEIGAHACVGPYVVIEEEVHLGDNCVLFPGVYIGRNSTVGGASVIHAHVCIREDSSIGTRAIIHAGAVIGNDGFGFVRTEEKQVKIPQVGGVVIGDDVEIGANVCIARGTLGDTVIGSETKIDCLVQIAHNVRIGRNCTIVAQVGISGSTVVEDNVTLAGQAGVIGHIRIGKNSVVAAQAGVTKDVGNGEWVSGYPAQPHHVAKRLNAELHRLPQLRQKVKILEEKIKELEGR